MNRLFLISTVCMQLGWISGVPHPDNNGVGAYAYQDSNGNRYGGTFGLNGEQTNLGNQEHQDSQGDFNPVPFGPDFDDFFPEYFRNFENLLQDRRATRSILSPLWPPLPPLQPLLPLRPLPPLRPLFPFRPLPPLQPLNPFTPINSYNRAFNSNRDYQKKALETARKAYDITSNQAGFIPHIDFSRFSSFGADPGFGNLGMGYGFTGPNSAAAQGLARPGLTHQLAAISPANPNMPNVDVTNRFSEVTPGERGFMSVSSTSYVTSSNVNGKGESHRGAETIVNNNGRVSHYKVEQ